MSTITPTGATLTASGDLLDFVGPWGFTAWFSGRRGEFRAGTASKGSFDAVEALSPAGRRPKGEVRYRDFHLFAYESVEHAFTSFLMMGAHHELYVTVGGVDVPFERFLGLMADFEAQDDVDGLVVRPRAGSNASVSLTMGGNTFVGGAGISVKPIPPGGKGLPAHAGRVVRGGIAWSSVSEYADSTLRSVIIANETTVTSIHAGGDADIANIVESIRIDLVGA